MEAWNVIFFVLGIDVGMLLGAGVVFLTEWYLDKDRKENKK